LIGGDPVQFTQVMPRTDGNSQIAALFANLKLGAQLGRRGVMEIRQSDQAFFTQRLIGVLAARRLSINIHGVGDTAKAGPIIGLISAAG
jgi:HK97 family phage major capsid protein